MKRHKMPSSDSIRDLAAFWDTHDVTDFEDELEEVSTPAFARRRPTLAIVFGPVTVPVRLHTITGEEWKTRLRDINEAIEVQWFVPSDSLPSAKLSACVRLDPVSGGERAYRLLVEAMKQERVRAIARSETGEGERAFLVRLLEDNLILECLETPRALSAKERGHTTELRSSELASARELVRQLSVARLPPARRRAPQADSTLINRPRRNLAIIRLDEWIAKRRRTTRGAGPERRTRKDPHVC